MRLTDTGWAREFAASPHAQAVTAALLAAAAVTEAAVRAAVTGVYGQSLTTGLLATAVLALSTTLPPAFLSAPTAALAVASAAALSLTAFRTLTAAGAVALALSLHHLASDPAPGGASPARRMRQGLALALPFTVIALLGMGLAGEARALAVLTAAAAPAAALAGAVTAARAEAHVHGAARQISAQSLLEHTARGERARIARELHDVVAHHISVIAVQAETARLTTPGMPPAGAARLSEIGDTARAGLTEMRRLLGVLRQDAEATTAERRPQPGLQQLNELVDEARSASGAGVRLIVSGPPAALDPGVELAAFRIVQEALTNVRRHARGAAVDVELHYGADTLRLRVRDNGPGPAPGAAAGGHGLPGMRERAAAAGGTLRTGPASGGGFLIEAALPAGAREAVR
ncbi:sensor histidine kinase [Actinacidiphila bryophytorum]|uniref:sensor histidine kinase n=1 Tax=Actinacidiphila bryophytorum TaxID=1436133 RepID=UPI002176D31B|nr:histidine kinase [Actinacidiphila bryophytorum]UWE09902.1 histidine kinase [Actinacidiphila bryophytorum]